MPKRHITLLSRASQLCGVEDFARQLTRRLPGQGDSWILGERSMALLRQLRAFDGLLFNFPVVAWKRTLVSPSFLAFGARLMRKDVVVVLHEWQALDWKRRAVLTPVVALATRLAFSAPEIADEFRRSRLSAISTADRRLIPIPPSLLPPAEERGSPARNTLDRQRAQGRMILGQFGSIYPKKQSTAVLDVARRLLDGGQDVFVVFIGSFIKGLDDVEDDFNRRVRQAALEGRVLVTGYVGDDSELFALFKGVDVFCYVFPEGLTSRRTSVLAAALVGRPVVVNAPQRPDALDHHVLYRRLIETQAVRLVANDADIDVVADAVLSAAASPPQKLEFAADIDAVWRGVVDTLSN